MSDQTIETLLQTVLPDDSGAVQAYYASKLPSPKDQEIQAVVEAYKKLDAARRVEAARSLGHIKRNWLDTYSFRMSILSVRNNDGALLLNGLVALLMTAPTSDSRDFIMSTPVLYRSAVLLGRGRAAFHEAASFAPDPGAKQLLLGFLDRDEKDQQLERWQYRELQGDHGLIYVYGAMPVPEGLK